MKNDISDGLKSIFIIKYCLNFDDWLNKFLQTKLILKYSKNNLKTATTKLSKTGLMHYLVIFYPWNKTYSAPINRF